MEPQEISADFFDCDPILLDDIHFLQSTLSILASQSGTKVVSTACHSYQPQGASVIVFVEESHLLLSTWPEHRIAVFNCLFTHGVNPQQLLPSLKQALGARSFSVAPFNRTWPIGENYPYNPTPQSSDL